MDQKWQEEGERGTKRVAMCLASILEVPGSNLAPGTLLLYYYGYLVAFLLRS